MLAAVNWLSFFGALWGLILALVGVFVYVDARNAFDGDPSTKTLSGYIKRWRRKSNRRSGLLATIIMCLLLVPAYLFAHLVLEIV